MKDPKLYRFLRPFLTFLIRLIIRPKILGLQNIPKKGNMVLAGNHISILDPVLLLSTNKRTIHFLAKKELIEGPFKFIFKNMGIIPVNRQSHDKNALETAIKYLDNGQIIGIFPEGTTRKKGKILPYKKGAVKMAYQTNSVIVPFAIIGSYNPFKKTILIFDKPYIPKENAEEETKILKDKVDKLIQKGETYGKNK